MNEDEPCASILALRWRLARFRWLRSFRQLVRKGAVRE